jgi:hypothetical protein
MSCTLRIVAVGAVALWGALASPAGAEKVKEGWEEGTTSNYCNDLLDTYTERGHHRGMDHKVSAVLTEDLVRRAKIESIRQRKPFGSLLGEALKFYLDEKGSPTGKERVSAASWATLKLDAKTLKNLLEQEDGFLDS